MKYLRLLLYSLLLLGLISCSMNQPVAPYMPIWWNQDVEDNIESCGQAVKTLERVAKFSAQNEAYTRFPSKIESYLNSYVAENCIEPGDDMIQAELDKIFDKFINYLMNVSQPQIEICETELIPVKDKGKKKINCYIQLKMKKTFLHNSFLEFLATSDMYINLKLKAILKDCFK